MLRAGRCRVPVRSGNFSFFPKRPGRLWDPLSIIFSGHLGVKQWSYTSAPPTYLHGVDSNNFTLRFLASRLAAWDLIWNEFEICTVLEQMFCLDLNWIYERSTPALRVVQKDWSHNKGNNIRVLSMHQTDALVSCLKNNIKIYIKICLYVALFGSSSLLPSSATYIHQ